MRSTSRLAAQGHVANPSDSAWHRWGLRLAAGGLVALMSSGCALPRLVVSAELARTAEPFQAEPASPTRRLLVVGDSTALGLGASSPPASVAGLIARDHPGWAIVNRAANSATFEDVADKQLAASGAGHEHFDTVLVMAGGSDVIHLTRSDTMREGILRTAQRAEALGDTVIFMPPGNVGDAAFFYPPWSWLMTQRAGVLRDMVRDAARAKGAVFVDLYRDKADDPFAQQPARYSSRDHLHPSDAGYRLWYTQLRAQAAAGL